MVNTDNCKSKASIIILVHNAREQIIRSILYALEKQTYKNFEIIMVDDAACKLRERMRIPEAATYICPPESSIPKSRNAGLRAATGHIVIFLDDDCIPIDSSWLKQHIETHSNSSVGAVAGPLLFDDKNLITFCDNISFFYDAQPRSETPYEITQYYTANLSIKKDLITQIGYFDEALLCREDFDFCRRIGSAGAKIIFNPAAAVMHKPARASLNDYLRHCLERGSGRHLYVKHHPEDAQSLYFRSTPKKKLLFILFFVFLWLGSSLVILYKNLSLKKTIKYKIKCLACIPLIAAGRWHWLRGYLHEFGGKK